MAHRRHDLASPLHREVDQVVNPLVVGIDPGGRWTGLIARQGDELLDHAVLEHSGGGGGMVSAEYLVAVVGWVAHWVDEMEAEIVGIEEATPPSWRIDGEVSPMAPGSLIGLGQVIGAVQAYYPDAIVVPQSGTAPLSTYPKALVGPRERTGTGGKLRHARSAWTVAGGAASLARRREAVK